MNRQLLQVLEQLVLRGSPLDRTLVKGNTLALPAPRVSAHGLSFVSFFLLLPLVCQNSGGLVSIPLFLFALSWAWFCLFPLDPLTGSSWELSHGVNTAPTVLETWVKTE